MIDKYIAFHPRFKVEIDEHKAIVLKEEDQFRVLQGLSVAELGWCLRHGVDNVDDLIRQLAGTLSRDEVQALLVQLEKDGYIAECPPDLSPRVLGLSSLLHVAPLEVAEALGRIRVTVSADRPMADAFLSILEDWEICVGPEADFTVVLTSNYLDPHLDAFNQEALHTGKPWMLVQIVGKVLYVGPILVPGRTACWACLTHRLRQNQRVDRFLEHVSDGPAVQSDAADLPSLRAIALHRAAAELARWIVRGRPDSLEGRLLRIDARTWEQAYHPVVRLPQCPACGDAHRSSLNTSAPLILVSRLKSHSTDGGHRILSPEDAFERFKHHLDPVAGVLHDLTYLDAPSKGLMHTFTIKHPMMSTVDTLEKLRINEFAGSSGKGKTVAQARASALFEALERLSAVWRGDEPVVMGTFEELKPDAIHLHRLLGFSNRQYAEREARNSAHASPALRIPEPFDERARIAWVRVHPVDDGPPRLIPAAYALFGNPETERPFCYADSNGNAAGLTLEEAVLQGLLELLERYSVAVWFYNRLRKPGVDLKAFNDPYFHQIETLYRQKLHRDLCVLDVTTEELGIPAMVAVSRRVDRQPEDIIMGYGCHLDARIAISRALAELNQGFCNVQHETADGATRYLTTDPSALAWLRSATLEGHSYLAPSETEPLKTAADHASLWAANDLLCDVLTCVRRVKACGLEPYVLNLTRSDLGVPVVKVVIPELPHYWRRLGHSLLYPGRILRSEEDLNPFSIVS